MVPLAITTTMITKISGAKMNMTTIKVMTMPASAQDTPRNKIGTEVSRMVGPTNMITTEGAVSGVAVEVAAAAIMEVGG